MQVTPLSHLYTIPSETPIPVIAGTLTDISPHKQGVSTMGQWAFQRAKLSDGQVQIQLVFKDRPPISPALQGRRIYIQSTNGHGVKAKDDFDKKKQTSQRVAWITGTAVIEVQDGNGQQQPDVPQSFQGQAFNQAAPQQYHQPAPYAPAPQVTMPPVGQLVQRTPQPDIAPKGMAGRAGMYYSLCLRSAILAVSRVQDEDPAFTVDPEHIKDIATTLFIQTFGKINMDGVPSILLPQPAPTAPPPAPKPAMQHPTENAPW